MRQQIESVLKNGGKIKIIKGHALVEIIKDDDAMHFGIVQNIEDEYKLNEKEVSEMIVNLQACKSLLQTVRELMYLNSGEDGEIKSVTDYLLQYQEEIIID